jgi:hypothetical protein
MWTEGQKFHREIDRETDRHDESNNTFEQISERT